VPAPSDLEQWAARLRETNPEILDGPPPGRTRARDRWHPLYQRVYGIRPWEIGRYTMKETGMLADDLEKNGLGSGL